MKNAPLFRLSALAAALLLSVALPAAEFKPLLNGHDLAGWNRWVGQPHKDKTIEGLKRAPDGKYLEPVGLDKDQWNLFSVVTQDGVPVLRISGEFFGALSTTASYGNYHLKMQMKWGDKRWPPRDNAKRDSGIVYHSFGAYGAADSNSWMFGQEFQVQEGDTGDYWGVGPVSAEMTATGAKRDQFKYDPAAPVMVLGQHSPSGRHAIKSPDAEKPTGQWNTLELICVGDEAIHVVNGQVVLRLKRLQQTDATGKFVPLTAGKIQLQSEGAEVYYRNIEIKSISEVPAEYRVKTTDLPRATPESQGISSAGIQALLDEVDARQLGLHSVMILRHGKVVAEGWWTPYAVNEPHMLYSLSKSFTSTAIGLLQAEGRLNIHDKFVSFFPEDVPADASDNLKNMRLRDLLMMSTGQEKADVDAYHNANPDETTVRGFMSIPVKQKPGALFYYNSPGSIMLAAVAQKVTGQNLRDYMVSRLFEPLGIPTPEWDQTREGITVGASGLHIRTEDIAKFGQLYLQRGEWNGRRLIPADWIDLATSRQASNGSSPDSDWDQGYGFQFWRCIPGFYRADGAFGQFCFIMPQHDTVVAITAGSRDTGGVMKLFWAKLLPELRAGALPEDPEALFALRNRLAGLALPLLTGAATSPLAAGISGRKFMFEKNDAALESVSLDVATDGSVTFNLRQGGVDARIAAGAGRWLKGTFPLTAGGTDPVTATGAWTADDTYTLQLAQYQLPFIATVRLKFAGNEVTYELTWNVNFRNRKAVPAITSKAP